MVDELVIDFSDLEELSKQFPRYAGIIADEMNRAMTGSLEIFKGQVVTRTPVGATGQARQSIGSLVRGQPPQFEGGVFITAPYGLPLERGRAPGRQPPTGPIQIWVERKLGLSGDEAEQAAFLIARSIGRRGTKGAAMFEKGFEAGKEPVLKLWGKAGERAAGRIERKMATI